jgi:hypothetical protein
MTAELLVTVLALALGFAAGWFARAHREQPDSGLIPGRCGAPIGRGRYCQRRPLKGSDRCGLKGHRRTDEEFPPDPPPPAAFQVTP